MAGVVKYWDGAQWLGVREVDNNLSDYVTKTQGDAAYVGLTGDQTVAGAKDFTGLITDDGRRLVKSLHDSALTILCAGAIRNDGSPDYWQPIIDSNHEPINVGSITTGSSAINVNFATAATGKRVTAIAVVDETLASKGFFVGASYSAGMLQLKLFRQWQLADYIYYDGSNWQVTNSRFTVSGFSSGDLTLTHEPIEGKDVSLTSRGASTLVTASTAGSSVVNTQTIVTFRDYTGAKITSPSTDMKFFITRNHEPGGAINVQAVDTASFPLSNIWFLALSEE